jgi:hypothetical protein
MDENAPRYEVFGSFRAEAAALLGITEQKPSTNHATQP